jgi:hypothetical protein
MLRISLTTLASLSSRMIFWIFRKLATLGPATHQLQACHGTKQHTNLADTAHDETVGTDGAD